MSTQYLNFVASRINCQFGIILYDNPLKVQVSEIKLSRFKRAQYYELS